VTRWLLRHGWLLPVVVWLTLAFLVVGGVLIALGD
jgi:hypothetical protein